MSGQPVPKGCHAFVKVVFLEMGQVACILLIADLHVVLDERIERNERYVRVHPSVDSL